MKRPSTPTLRQKQILAKWGKNPADWSVVAETNDRLIILHKYSTSPRMMMKGGLG